MQNLRWHENALKNLKRKIQLFHKIKLSYYDSSKKITIENYTGYLSIKKISLKNK